LVIEFKDTLVIIANGGNIWDRTNPEMEEHCHKVLHHFAAQSASQQNNEQFVKATSHLKKTGKSEQKANIYGIASNGFCTEVFSQDHSITNNDNFKVRKRVVTKGLKRVMYLVEATLDKVKN